MKGLPKTLNSKQDYLYLKENTSKEYYVPFFQELLDSRFGWYFVENLPTGKEGINDDTHKIVVNEGMRENEEITYAQYELKENENAKIFRLGFTVEEVQKIIE